MATIVERGPSRWQVRIRREGFPRLSKCFDTHRAALAWARQIEGEIDAGQFVDRSTVEQSFVALLNRYCAEISPTKRSGNREASKLRPYLSHPLFLRPLNVITPRDMAEARDWRLSQVTPGTVLREFSLLRHVLEVARKEWFLPVSNVVSGIRLPTANRPRERRLRGDEEERLMAAAKEYGGEIAAIVAWLIETAMRREEAVTVTVSQIDFENSVVRLDCTKNGSRRGVPLSEKALQIASQALQRSADKLFSMRPDSVTQAFGRVCRRAGIDDLTLHDLRHEATSRLVEAGFSMPEVMAITGHKDPKMMLRYYQPNVPGLARRLRDGRQAVRALTKVHSA